MAPPSSPAPKPQPKPLPHTVSMSVPDAFLIASGSANGVADATLEAAAKLAASMAATTMFGIRSIIDFTPFFRALVSAYPKRMLPPVQFLYKYATEIRPPDSNCPRLCHAPTPSPPENPLTSFRCGRWAATPIKHSDHGRLPTSL